MKVIKMINGILFMILLLLLINLLQPINVLVGKIVYSLDLSEPRCYFIINNELREIPVDMCCYRIQKQLNCKSISGESNLKCYSSEASTSYYLINYKTLSYCKNEGYDIKVE